MVWLHLRNNRSLILNVVEVSWFEVDRTVCSPLMSLPFLNMLPQRSLQLGIQDASFNHAECHYRKYVFLRVSDDVTVTYIGVMHLVLLL
jgi:hypothetical protein